jgi:hypothetical protein
MNLPEACGCKRIGIHLRKNLPIIRDGARNDPLDLRERDRGNLILELSELRDPLLWQKIRPGAEYLSELDEGGSQSFQKGDEPLGSGTCRRGAQESKESRPRGWHPSESHRNLSKPVLDEKGKDLAKTLDIPHRSGDAEGIDHRTIGKSTFLAVYSAVEVPVIVFPDEAMGLLPDRYEDGRGVTRNNPLLNGYLKEDRPIPEVHLPFTGKELIDLARAELLNERIACGIRVKVPELTTEKKTRLL